MYGSGPVGRELVGSEAVQRSRSEAGSGFGIGNSIRSRLLYLDVMRLREHVAHECTYGFDTC